MNGDYLSNDPTPEEAEDNLPCLLCGANKKTCDCTQEDYDKKFNLKPKMSEEHSDQEIHKAVENYLTSAGFNETNKKGLWVCQSGSGSGDDYEAVGVFVDFRKDEPVYGSCYASYTNLHGFVPDNGLDSIPVIVDYRFNLSDTSKLILDYGGESVSEAVEKEKAKETPSSGLSPTTHKTPIKQVNSPPTTNKPATEKLGHKPVKTTALTPKTEPQGLVTGKTFDNLLKQAEVLVESGFLPQEVKTPASAVAIMLTGQEIGIPVMQSFRSIYIVKGKPTLSAQLIGALIFRGGHKYTVIESSDTKCTLKFFRSGDEEGKEYTFTMEDAKRAKLESGDAWRKYPKAMLFSRCISAGARMIMPDVVAGLYTPEELADDVVFNPESGETIPVVEAEVVK